jgi:RES domain-containing protein
MEVFRLSRRKYSDTLSGKGAAIKGARWNYPGVEVIYTASNRSLAMAEVAVHLSVGTLPDDFVMVTISIPDDVVIDTVLTDNLPHNWNQFPYSTSTQKIGSLFVMQRQFCALKVPSAVTKGDYNVMINPFHQDFKRIGILGVEEFTFDRRLFR